MGYHLNQSSEKALVASILGGNIQGFASVVNMTERLVTHIVRKLTTNEDDQKDLVQEIYVKAYQNLPTFQFKSKLSTWIAHIAYNTTINYLQKKKIPILDSEHIKDVQVREEDNPEAEIIKTETAKIIATELEQLPPLYKTLLTLYHLEEIPTREISEITSLPEGTVKSYLFRARKMLKDRLMIQFKREEL